MIDSFLRLQILQVWTYKFVFKNEYGNYNLVVIMLHGN